MKSLLKRPLTWIAPSRIGYLRSTFRAGATFDDQAHAYAYLLDHLGIKKVAVLHPERVSALTLISAGVAASTDANQSQANQKGDMPKTIFQHDYLYWVISRVFKAQLMELMGADKQVIRNLTPEQRDLVEKIIEFMNPVVPRSAGTVFDNQAAIRAMTQKHIVDNSAE